MAAGARGQRWRAMGVALCGWLLLHQGLLAAGRRAGLREGGSGASSDGSWRTRRAALAK